MSSSFLGPIMADVGGYSLTEREKRRLLRPEIGGVILFRRNYQSISQIQNLVSEIKQIKSPELLVAVDHEGGRVQRFIDGFTRLPAMRILGKIYDEQSRERALEYAQLTAWVLATELRALNIDFSFTPVLDLDWGRSGVIGDRSFHSNPDTVIELTGSFIEGLKRGGMQGCGKHYPGHGYVEADSHCVLPEDHRDFQAIQVNDLLIFSEMIKKGLSAIMPAHVIYSAVDTMPAGYSKIWLKDILREQLNFKGLIFSDSLTMEGACGVGDIVERVLASQQAGCDILLICNRPDLVDSVLANTHRLKLRDCTDLWHTMRDSRPSDTYRRIVQTYEFKKAREVVASLCYAGDLMNGFDVGEAS
ncbi:MAG: beta-N-acetylhexosaminidase [Neisseriaceae bacterium]|nr:MAG: beta-N-acetylhexosaminidase [Neisseriaceae bacterium]